MSKSKIRIVLSVLISLGVMFAVYTTVLGAPFDSAASHSASDKLANSNGLIVTEREAYYNQLDTYNNSTPKDGHDCRDQYNGPID